MHKAIAKQQTVKESTKLKCPLTFYLTTPAGQSRTLFRETSQHLQDGLAEHLVG